MRLIPVEDLLKENGVPFDVNDYISGVRYFYADTKGKMVGMPFNSSTPILYYNVKAALEKAGVTPPKTWEEFQTVTGPKLKEAGYVPLAQSHLPWIFTENFFSRHNIQFATENNGYASNKAKMLVNNDHLKAHFTAVKKWYDDGPLRLVRHRLVRQPAARSSKSEVAMWMGSSASFGGLKKSAGFEFSATFLPYWEA